jgi:hypothetical protein
MNLYFAQKNSEYLVYEWEVSSNVGNTVVLQDEWFVRTVRGPDVKVHFLLSYTH